MRCTVFLFVMMLLSCNGQKKYHTNEVEEKIAATKSDKLKGILEYHKKLNDEYKDAKTSPLPNKYRKDFEGLDFFEPDTNYVVKARLELALGATPFLMPTTTNQNQEYKLYGRLFFKLNGKDLQLEVYQNQQLIKQEKYKDHLFLPFLDNTNGKETYGGGRYIELSEPDEDFIMVDFNRAYNPYCAYSKKYSCPVVPLVNTLDTEVRAGVKAFNKEH
ncbi:DUF1684 domain-containing protein [Cellulophaga lytica]|uniref:DUF1684 domain-containing protein n=1 Tax=Cellulophaga lytica TaxID=979 RepID=UPI000B5CB929|nr:DUF1684 domain-containing protein [Cellulophaga lytica]SNQ42948.1 Conserved hypothetical protein [Cellulophaga lytica]